MHDQSPGSGADPGRGLRAAWTGVALAAAAALLLFTGLRGCSESPSAGAGAAAPVVVPASVPAQELAKLTQATTFTTVAAATPDPAPFAVTDGTVMHPLTAQVVYAAPGGKPVALLPATELGGPTWVPVVQTVPGWVDVLLPSR